MKHLNKLYPHLLAIFGFVLISLIYFYPVLQGKALYQSDIAQYTGMAKEQNDFRTNEKTEPFWTNSAFGGMPTYQMGANYPHNYIKKVDELLRFLPRPADYLFLYFFGFYCLLLVLKTDPLKAFFGALAFGFSTYLIIILGVGHNAKAHAIAYFPLVLAGFLLTFQRKYILGGLISLFAIALEINANHFQMTYYLMILLMAITIFYVYKSIKNKEIQSLFYSFGMLLFAGILAIGANATGILATAEYADFSIRGKSELTFNADGSKNKTDSAMNYDYITEYSYGIAESLNLFAPRLFGGSNTEKLDDKSKVYEFIAKKGANAEEAKSFTENYGMTYWGEQPIVAAPAYIGAIVFFLAILCLFNDKRKIKYAFLGGAIFALMLSWGKNFSILTNFFIDYVPMYDKFRAVSSVQVVLELCLPILAIMGLQTFFKSDKEQKFKTLWKSSAVALGIIVVLFLFKGLFNFSGSVDQQLLQMFGKQTEDPGFGIEFIDALKSDRQSMYITDLMRTGFLILLVAGLLWMNLKNKLSQSITVTLIGILMVGDLVLVDKKYVDTKGFVSKQEVIEPFQPTPADLEILKDKSIYRVYDIQGRLQARSSYFHKTIGGYSAVRPRRLDQLFDYIIDKDLTDLAKNIDEQTLTLTKNSPILDALNVKYILVPTENGDISIRNPFINGNAWFVNDVKIVNSADEEMEALQTTDLKKTAIINQKYSTDFKSSSIAKDTVSSINLITYKPNYINYSSTNDVEGLAVFSEIYYPKGWNVYIDGKIDAHFRVDYVLRGMKIPAGKHTIEFKFEPQVVKTGSTIALISSILMLFLLIGGIYFENRKKLND
jgi:Bacterial membrane protein YfhO